LRRILFPTRLPMGKEAGRAIRPQRLGNPLTLGTVARHHHHALARLHGGGGQRRQGKDRLALRHQVEIDAQLIQRCRG
jgi:hypothetical protein